MTELEKEKLIKKINEKIRKGLCNHEAGHFLASILTQDIESFLIRVEMQNGEYIGQHGRNIPAHLLREPDRILYKDFNFYILAGVASNYMFKDDEIEDFDEYIQFLFDEYCNVNEEQDYSKDDDDISQFLFMIQRKNYDFDEYLILEKYLRIAINLLIPYKELLVEVSQFIYDKKRIEGIALEELKTYVIDKLNNQNDVKPSSEPNEILCQNQVPIL